jgi:carbamoyl-phosphate synthase small subunit
MSNCGILALEDGTIIRGKAFGASRTVVGEIVFNTSMTGYQEILTDPSYSGQIVTFTTPQIGNYGTHPDDEESDAVHARGLIIQSLSPITRHWRSQLPLADYLKKHGIPGIEHIDTRMLTRKIRTAGALKACLSTEAISEENALKRAQDWEGLGAHDYVSEVSCKLPYSFNPESKQYAPFSVPGTQLNPTLRPNARFRIAALDFGAKRSIFKKLSYHGFDIEVFPAHTSADMIREFAPQGVFLSNGPGDPAILESIHKTVATLIQHYPTFGICLGHQLITHALGAKTHKLKFGHHGGNHPVKNLETGVVSITSQNHGYASTWQDMENCGARVTEINLNDNTIEGIHHNDLPVFSVQYHPEAAPGPNDAEPLFERFYELVQEHA